MIDRTAITGYMSDINKEGATPETMALALVLSVLLDIRDQNTILLEKMR